MSANKEGDVPETDMAPSTTTTADEEKRVADPTISEDATTAATSAAGAASASAVGSPSVVNGTEKGSKVSTAHTRVASSAAKRSAPSSSPKKSRWMQIIDKLVPCLSTSRGHDDVPLAPTTTKKTIGDSAPAESSPAGTKKLAASTPESKAITKDESAPEKATTTGAVPASTAAPSTPPPSAPQELASENDTPAAPSTPPRAEQQQKPSTPSAVQTDLVPPPAIVTDVVVPPSPSKLLPPAETAGVTSGAVQPPGSTGKDEDEETPVVIIDEDGVQQEADEPIPDEDDEDQIIHRGGLGIPIVDGVERPLLPPVAPEHKGRKCLVLDLDETLLHSSFKLIPQCDYVVPVEIEWQWHNVYVIKRPGVDAFLKKMGELFEIVVFTASLSKYADPVLDKLDVHKVVSHRLFRESCYNHKGNYVKDLSQLGRPLTETIILDNSPASYIFHPNNAVPVSSWFNDPHDTELTDLCPFLTDLRLVDDIRGVLDGGI